MGLGGGGAPKARQAADGKAWFCATRSWPWEGSGSGCAGGGLIRATRGMCSCGRWMER